MDDFKRFYSNNDEDKSVPYFWEKFDPEHYSVWRCDYKYNDELTMVFMSCNLIGGKALRNMCLSWDRCSWDFLFLCAQPAGMFQRLEKLRKNAFASVCLFGENNNSTISGRRFERQKLQPSHIVGMNIGTTFDYTVQASGCGEATIWLSN